VSVNDIDDPVPEIELGDVPPTRLPPTTDGLRKSEANPVVDPEPSFTDIVQVISELTRTDVDEEASTQLRVEATVGSPTTVSVNGDPAISTLPTASATETV